MSWFEYSLSCLFTLLLKTGLALLVLSLFLVFRSADLFMKEAVDALVANY